jgi:hypothetical protein
VQLVRTVIKQLPPHAKNVPQGHFRDTKERKVAMIANNVPSVITIHTEQQKNVLFVKPPTLQEKKHAWGVRKDITMMPMLVMNVNPVMLENTVKE